MPTHVKISGTERGKNEKFSSHLEETLRVSSAKDLREELQAEHGVLRGRDEVLVLLRPQHRHRPLDEGGEDGQQLLTQGPRQPLLRVGILHVLSKKGRKQTMINRVQMDREKVVM
jgi:hypothetical protein